MLSRHCALPVCKRKRVVVLILLGGAGRAALVVILLILVGRGGGLLLFVLVLLEAVTGGLGADLAVAGVLVAFHLIGGRVLREHRLKVENLAKLHAPFVDRKSVV